MYIEPEFNFGWDPDAASIVLDLFKCNKTILPKKSCLEGSLAIPLVYYKQFVFLCIPMRTHFDYNSQNCALFSLRSTFSLGSFKEWRFGVLGALTGPNIDFLNEVERLRFVNFKHFILCDAFLAALVVFPECVRQQNAYYATIELNNRETRGQICISHDQNEKQANVTIIELLNEEAIKKALIFAIDVTKTFAE